MKLKTILVAVTVTIAGAAFSQTSGSNSETQELHVKSDQLVFQSEEEKRREIEKIEKLIQLRKSQGRTDEQLMNHYNELDRAKNAKIIAQ